MSRLWPLLLAAPAFAHVVSMSSGDLSVEGTHARYELRMPLYEIAHVPHGTPCCSEASGMPSTRDSMRIR